MSSDISKLTVKQLGDMVKNTEKTLQNKGMIEKLPDKGQKLLDSLKKLSNELKFRRDIEKTTECIHDLALAPKGSTPETYALKRAEAIDEFSRNSPDRKHKEGDNCIKKLTCVESLRVIDQKMTAEKETAMLFPVIRVPHQRLVNYREEQGDSDDDDNNDDDDDNDNNNENDDNDNDNEDDGQEMEALDISRYIG